MTGSMLTQSNSAEFPVLRQGPPLLSSCAVVVLSPAAISGFRAALPSMGLRVEKSSWLHTHNKWANLALSPPTQGQFRWRFLHCISACTQTEQKKMGLTAAVLTKDMKFWGSVLSSAVCNRFFVRHWARAPGLLSRALLTPQWQ